MGNVYFRNRDGELEPVRKVHVVEYTATAKEGLDVSVNEFNQMNDHVSAYLAAASAAYTDDNGGSVSVIEAYRTAEDDADRPLGYPLTAESGSVYVQSEDSGDGWKLAVGSSGITRSIYNALPGEVSQYLVKDADGELLENGRILPKGKVRMIRFFGYNRNCRDLGGWACDGGSVKYGKLFRSAVIASQETWIDPQIGENVGIQHHIDFRGDEEAGYITESALGASVRYHRIPLELYYADCVSIGSSDFANLKKLYRTILDAALHDEGVVFNCSLGRDRTGTVAFMLLALLGVAKADIDKDYELTSFSALDTAAVRTGADYNKLSTYLSTFGGATLRDNAVWWFIKAGFRLDELNAFRAAMSTGTPELLKAEDFVATYSIANNLSFCETDNDATSAEEGTAYTATITPVSGYSIESVVVVMGGADVTEQVYADGVITIQAVTGDVKITAKAVYVPAYTNQIPISTDTDGSIFNGVGYREGWRINSSGELSEAPSCHVTGFIPCTNGDVIRFKDYPVNTGSASTAELRTAFYDSDRQIIPYDHAGGWMASMHWSYFFTDDADVDEQGDLRSITVPEFDPPAAYVRFTNYYTTGRSIITVNEEIE